MIAERIERRYALTKVKIGDYLLPSNDGLRIYRLARDEGEGWSVYRWTEFIGAGGTVDFDDWSRWECVEQWIPTRADAIQAALRIGPATR